jgi:hypothetical protein
MQHDIIAIIPKDGFTGTYVEPGSKAVTFKEVDEHICRFPVGRMNLLNPEESLCCGAGVVNPKAKRGHAASYCCEHLPLVAVKNKEPKKSRHGTRQHYREQAPVLQSRFEDFLEG